MTRLLNCSLLAAALIIAAVLSPVTLAQTPKKVVRIFLDVRETNLEKPSAVAVNTLSERLSSSGFRVTTSRRDAMLIVDGTISSRSAPVTDEVKRQSGVNAEATASVRLLVGSDVIATSVERSAPGDWGVQPERVGEDRLIEVAGRIADDLFAADFLLEVMGQVQPPASTQPRPPSKAPSKPRAPKQPRRGVSFLEVASLVQNSAPEERIVAALRKYGIKFKPVDVALNQLRSLGASDTLIKTVKSSNVLV
ncbi:MAG: hypothetical protein ABI882_02755 [Acidobacteriota bacterium]